MSKKERDSGLELLRILALLVTFWMQEHLGKVDAGLMAGLGGSLDVFAGVVERAPEKWQKLGLEWLYRLMQDPKRLFRRYFATNFKFLRLTMGRK